MPIAPNRLCFLASSQYGGTFDAMFACGRDLIADPCRIHERVTIRKSAALPLAATRPRLEAHGRTCVPCAETSGRSAGAVQTALCSEFRKGWASASDTDAQSVAVSATANLGDAASGVGAASPNSFLEFWLQKRRTRHSHFGEHRVTCDK